jgi:3-oxoacyl-[acyl-carrier-protein] synthase-1
MTAVGLDAPSTAAAVRCGISGSVETRYMDAGGNWLLGCPLPLESRATGLARLKDLAVPAITECLRAALGVKAPQIPLFLIVAEPSRPGRPDGLEEELRPMIEAELGIRFHAASRTLAGGRLDLLEALRGAGALLSKERLPGCIIAGVDSLLVTETLSTLEDADRLLTSENSNGFIPGEAGAAVLVDLPPKEKAEGLLCRGIGEGVERSTVDSGEPLRADGLVQAFREALRDAKATTDDLDYRLTDLNGEQYGFKEAALAIGRTIRKVKPDIPLWHPAECIGDVGAAAGPGLLALALIAARKGYAPGPGVLCHLGSDDGRRGALILRHYPRSS